MKKVLKVCGYCRVSTDEQKNYGFSISAQEDKIKNYCKEKNYILTNIYIDEGFSASNIDRPALQELLKSLDDIDAIILTRLDRLSRDVLQARKMVEIFIMNNISLITLEESDIDTTSADGMFTLNLKLSLAERELKKTSERIKSVFEYKIKEGQAITGAQPFGYKVDIVNGKKCVVFDENKEILNEIFSYFGKHHSVRKTMFYINEKYNLDKHYSTYSRTLRNPYYTGSYKGNENYCPAYIDKKTFERNQELIKSNIRVNKNRRHYFFTGLIICPVCGRKLAASPAPKDNHRYRCNSAVFNRCSFDILLAERKTEKVLLNTIENHLENHIINSKRINKVGVKDFSKEINSIKKELENLNYLFKKNRISLKDYDREYDELELELKKLENVVVEEIDLKKFETILNSDWKSIYINLNREKKQIFWRNLIKEIHIIDDRYIFDIKF